MDFKGLGGFAFAVIAGLLLFLIMPGSASSAESERSDKKSSAPKNSNRQTRLRNTTRLFSGISLIAFAASIVVGFMAIAQPVLWFALIGTVPVLLASAMLATSAARVAAELQRVSPQRINRRISFENIVETKSAPIENERAWVPTKLPAPLSNRLGELRQVAPVVSFESAKADADAELAKETKAEIDVLEILKRRRAI